MDIRAPVFVTEKSIALADAFTWSFHLLLLRANQVTDAAARTIVDATDGSTWELKLPCVLFDVLNGWRHMCVM